MEKSEKRKEGETQNCRDDLQLFFSSLTRLTNSILEPLQLLYELNVGHYAAGDEREKRSYPYVKPIRLQLGAFWKAVEEFSKPPLREEMFFYDLCLKVSMLTIATEALCDCIIAAWEMAKDDGEEEIALMLGGFDIVTSERLAVVQKCAAPFKVWAGKIDLRNGDEYQPGLLDTFDVWKKEMSKLNQEDRTITEIAENHNITRQAAAKRLKRRFPDHRGSRLTPEQSAWLFQNLVNHKPRKPNKN